MKITLQTCCWWKHPSQGLGAWAGSCQDACTQQSEARFGSQGLGCMLMGVWVCMCVCKCVCVCMHSPTHFYQEWQAVCLYLGQSGIFLDRKHNLKCTSSALSSEGADVFQNTFSSTSNLPSLFCSFRVTQGWSQWRKAGRWPCQNNQGLHSNSPALLLCVVQGQDSGAVSCQTSGYSSGSCKGCRKHRLLKGWVVSKKTILTSDL